MRKSSVFILLLLIFCSYFFLRKIFVVISDSLHHATFVEMPSGTILSKVPSADEKVDIIGALNPHKVIRGSAFELALFVKTYQRTYGNYTIAVTLVKPDNTIKINAGEYPIKSTRDWPKSDKIQIGPFMVSVPEVASLGTYVVEIRLLQSDTSALASEYNGTAIEVVSYNQARGQ